MATKNRTRGSVIRWIMVISIWTFFLAVAFSIASQLLMQGIRSTVASLVILGLIIATGVVADMVGTAAAAADVVPLNAKASRKEYGAKIGVILVQRAEQVANFANDVIGDITGIVSGLVGAVIVFRLVVERPGYMETYLSIIVTAIIAALTVGGKAYGKMLAIHRSTEIILFVGKIFTRIAELWPVYLLKRRINSRTK